MIYRDTFIVILWIFSGIDVLSNPPRLRERRAQCRHAAEEEKEGMEQG